MSYGEKNTTRKKNRLQIYIRDQKLFVSKLQRTLKLHIACRFPTVIFQILHQCGETNKIDNYLKIIGILLGVFDEVNS